MSKLNFAIALKMTTDQFKRGADAVKMGLRQIQYQVIGMASALGLGTIGLKNMVSQFVNVARETTRARVALRNISGDANGFAENMNFLHRSSKRWGQELNGMTFEFAKFSAAASSAGIPIKQQQEIFESFTRSITAFGMSSTDAHLSYLALSQMMSKGKISSEELRRQLGERMPVAMEAMARAVGVTIQELDGLLKAGKLISKDVMLPFVKEMEKMLPEVNVDNIETSVNRLKNTFIQLTQDLRIGEYFKKIVDWANGMLSNIQTSFARVAAVIVSSIAGAKIFKAFANLRAQTAKTNASILNEKIRTEQQMQLATQKRIAAENSFNNYSTLYHKASNDQKLQHYSRYVAAEKALDKARLREKAAMNAFEVASAAKTTSVWATAWKSIRTIAVAALGTIKAMMASIIPMAIIGGITNAVMRLRELKKEAKEIKNIFSDFQEEVSVISAGQEVKMLESSLAILNDKKSTQDQINNAQSTLQSKLGVEKKTQEELVALTRERIKALKDAASVDFYAQKSVSTQDEIDSIYSKYGGEASMDSKRRLRSVGDQVDKRWKELWGGKTEIDLDYDRIQELYKVLNESESKLQGLVGRGTAVTPTTGTTTVAADTRDGKETPLQKAEKEYAESLKKLINQKEAGAIKTEDYNKAIDDLNKATYEEIAGILGLNAERNKTFQLAKQGVDNPLSISDELGKVNKEYRDTLRELNEKQRLGLISEEQYNSSLLSLINSTAEKIASFEKVGDAEEEYINALKEMREGLAKEPERGDRDTTFDYKKTESDKLREELSLEEEFAQRVREKWEEVGEYGVEAMNEIAEAEANVTSLSDALKLAQLKEDLESIKTDLFSESIDGVTGFANALDRVANSWSRLANEDLSGFEKTVAFINAMGDTIKGLTEAWESYNAIKDLISTRDKIRQAQENANTAQSLANTAAEVAASSVEVAANTAEGATEATASAAKLPFPANLAAMGAAAAAAIAIFASIPKFAKGGIVGGLSRSGDNNLIRANAGEMVVTTAQQSKLWNAIQKGDFGNNQSGNVEFKIKGRDLIGIINQEGKIKSRV